MSPHFVAPSQLRFSTIKATTPRHFMRQHTISASRAIMRLLRLDADGGIEIIEPRSTSVRRYAILSHTWGNDGDEVTLQDLRDGSAKLRPGYKKLLFCAKKAALDNLTYFWVDTCCIDKTSSAELSSAINSMYRWYKEAERCYVYLDDVHDMGLHYSAKQISSSRWFTRGWTLQELLAPLSVKFFERNGAMLGDKESLGPLISKITTIPLAALQSLSPGKYSRHERMRWAKIRTTTLEEDQVYCLLGLFGVSMPVIYGEGLANAELRLEDAIERKAGLESIMFSRSACNNKDLDSRSGLGPTGVAGPDDQYPKDDREELEAARRAAVEPLWFPRINSRLVEIDNPALGTCTWLENHPLYRAWSIPRCSPIHSGILWLKGHPGVGKSVAVKQAAANMQTEPKTDGSLNAAFYFSAEGHELERTVFGLYRSLLYQLSMQNFESTRELALITAGIPKISLEGYQLGHRHLTWTLKQLTNYVDVFISRWCQGQITIFVDALDECDYGQARELVNFWYAMVKKATHLRVCFSSRHFPVLSLGGHPVIIAEDCNASDIAAYVDHRLLLPMSEDSNIRAALRNAILERASGAFLWASLVLDDLLEKYDEGNNMRFLMERLDLMPKKLRALFRHMFEHMPENERQLSKPLFRWAVLAVAPLRAEEWHHILAIISHSPVPASLSELRASNTFTESDGQLNKRLRTISRGLVGIQSSVEEVRDDAMEATSIAAGAGSLDPTHGNSRLIRVAHESVYSYIQNKLFGGYPQVTCHGRPFRCGSPIEDLKILQNCLDYLDMRELDAFVDARNMIADSVVDTVSVCEDSRSDSSLCIENHGRDRDGVPSPVTHNAPSTCRQNRPSGAGQAFHKLTDLNSAHKKRKRHLQDSLTSHAVSKHIKSSSGTFSTSPAQFSPNSKHPLRQNDVGADVALTVDHPSCGHKLPQLYSEDHRVSSPASDIWQWLKNIQIGHEEKVSTGTTMPPLQQQGTGQSELYVGNHAPNLQEPQMATSKPVASTTSVGGEDRSQMLGDHLALLPYISAHFWEHARRAQAMRGADLSLFSIIVDRVSSHRTWRRWQAIDPLARPCAGVSEIDLQCAYLEHQGLHTWVEYIRAKAPLPIPSSTPVRAISCVPEHLLRPLSFTPVTDLHSPVDALLEYDPAPEPEWLRMFPSPCPMKIPLSSPIEIPPPLSFGRPPLSFVKATPKNDQGQRLMRRRERRRSVGSFSSASSHQSTRSAFASFHT
ncbi:ankyrin repeat domain-containing protein 50 [Microdochium nivale]|nr:ankyrin repeat domain-containing protein 50 [Microdochium nivale]